MRIFHHQHEGPSPKTAVVIMVRDRYYLVRLFLSSLSESRLDDALIILVDDASQTETSDLLRNFSLADTPIVKIVIGGAEHKHIKIYDILRTAWDLAVHRYGCRYLGVLDSDTLVRPDWLSRMRALHRQHCQDQPRLLVSAYNSAVHKTLERGDGFERKSTAGGVSLLFSTSLYRTVVRDSMVDNWDWALVRTINELSGSILALSPSAIQHTGCLRGTHSGFFKQLDYSTDYNGRLFFILNPLFFILHRISFFLLHLSKWGKAIRTRP